MLSGAWNKDAGGSALRTSVQSLLLRLAGLASTFGMGVILARALGPADFGIYGLVIAIATVVGTIALIGTPQLAVREFSARAPSRDWRGIKSLIFMFGLSTICMSALFGLIAIAVWHFAGSGDSASFVYLIQGALLVPLLALTGLIASELRGLAAMFKGQFLDIFGKPTATLLVVAAFLIVRGDISAPTALWIQVAVGSAALALSYLWIRQALPAEARQVKPEWTLGWLAAALPLGAVDIIRQLDGAYGMLLMAGLASASDLGVFRVALSCAVVAGLPATILHVVMAPDLARLHRHGTREELQALLSKASASLFAILLPLTILAYLLGKPVVGFVFGQEYASAWLPLFVLCLGQLLFGFFGMGPILLAMCDDERALFKIYLIAVATAIVCAVPLITFYGSTGAALAQLVSLGLIGLLSRWRARRTLGLELTFLGYARDR